MKFKINGVTYTEAQVKQLARMGVLDLSALRRKNDPASTSLANTQAPHGFNAGGTGTARGLFAGAGVRPEMFSAIQQPRSIMGVLPLRRSEFANETVEVLTSQAGNQGTDADGFCGNPPAAGDLAVARQVRVFGKWMMRTQLNAIPELGKRVDYADLERVIQNAAPSDPFFPAVVQSLVNTRDPLAFELYKLGTAARRATSRVAWTGVGGANATNNDGYFSEFSGFDTLVKTGYTDSVTSAAVPALDSIVVNWNADVAATVAGSNIVARLHDLYYSSVERASAVGMSVRHVFAMTPQMFRALVDVYACSYATYRCVGTNAGDPVTRDGMAVQQLRAEMMTGRYLLVDGVPVPVVVDDGIPMTRALATDPFSTTIYLIPIEDDAGVPLTYLQYFPMDNEFALRYVGFVNSDKVAFLNDGLFIVGERSTGLCVEYHMAMQARLMLETPWLAARIDNVQFAANDFTRQPNPGDPLYAGGGRTTGS